MFCVIEWQPNLASTPQQKTWYFIVAILTTFRRFINQGHKQTGSDMNKINVQSSQASNGLQSSVILMPLIAIVCKILLIEYY